jgi:ankyrin repeat protein
MVNKCAGKQDILNLLIEKIGDRFCRQVIVEFLDEGLEINECDKWGDTALMVASRYGRIGMAKLLIKEGAEVNMVDPNGITPLHMACFAPAFEVVKLLVGKGAYVDVCDNHGRTPLHCACTKKRTDVIKLLLDEGADMYHKDDQGVTPLNVAHNYGCDRVIDCLMTRVEENKQRKSHKILFPDGAELIVLGTWKDAMKVCHERGLIPARISCINS